MVAWLLVLPGGLEHGAPRTHSQVPAPAAESLPSNEEHVRNLSREASPAATRTSLAALKSAEVDAFPALLDHLNDDTIAADSLTEATREPTTLGRACFSLLREHIEGSWPKSVRGFHVLSPGNARAWLEARRGVTLQEMRSAARKEAIAAAEAELAADPRDVWVQRSLHYLRDSDSGPTPAR